ncbi:MAG: RHS repeat-associated core domain-containing protein [Acidimicrobiales bacterium]
MGSYRPRIRNCQKHASARSRRFVPADPDRDCRFCTSRPVNYERPSQHTSDGSINRYYDPATGQFLSVDPLVDETEQPYEYAGDDPVNGSDPTGLCNAKGNGNAWDLFNPWSGNNPIRCSVEKNSNSTTTRILEANPAYIAVNGYMSEAEAAESGCGLGTELGYGAEGVLGVAGTLGIAAGGAGLAEGLAGSTADEATPFAEDNVGHIFRDAAGHLAEDTPENRAIIQDTVSPENYIGTDSNGVATYRLLLPNGTQSWAEVYQGEITNGGVNSVPR